MKLNNILVALATAALLTSCGAESATTTVDSPGAVTQAETGATGSVQTIRADDAKALLDQQKDIVILDIRTIGEYKSGHLSNAVNLDYYASDFPEKLRKLDHNKSYLVYCAVGGRSREAVRLMQKLGFQQVYDATEGYNDLKRAGLAVTK